MMSNLPTSYELKEAHHIWPTTCLSKLREDCRLYSDVCTDFSGTSPNRSHTSGTFVFPIVAVGETQTSVVSTDDCASQVMQSQELSAAVLNSVPPINDFSSDQLTSSQEPYEAQPLTNLISCNSPESGFGSDHHGSPRLLSKVRTDVESQETLASPAQGLPQIVSITSLAHESPNVAPSSLYESSENRRRKRRSTYNFSNDTNKTCDPIACGKRLNIHHDNRSGKKVLKLTWKDSGVDLYTQQDVQQSERFNSLSEPVSRCCHFDHHMKLGLPALTCCRDRLEIDHLVERYASYYGSRQQSPKSLVDKFREESSRLFHPDSLAGRKLAKTSSSPVLETKTKSTDNSKPKLSLKAPLSSIEESSGLHSDLHSNKMKILSPRTIASAMKTATCKSSSCKSTDTPTKLVNSEQTNCKRASNAKIERLKEILRQREKKLEAVRRNCGFIN